MSTVAETDKTIKACQRCVSKKRKCDMRRPTCSNCDMAAADCLYVSGRRRGPVAGLARAAEQRASACEDALSFVLGLPGVREALRALPPDAVIPPSRTRPDVNTELGPHWARYPLRTMADLQSLQAAKSDHNPAPTSAVAYEPPRSPNTQGLERPFRLSSGDGQAHGELDMLKLHDGRTSDLPIHTNPFFTSQCRNLQDEQAPVRLHSPAASEHTGGINFPAVEDDQELFW